MRKKRFNISKDISDNIEHSINAGVKHQGELHYEVMDLSIIETDPKNPRKLSISFKEIKPNDLNKTFKDNKKEKEFRALALLAESIKKVGVRNAIEVYREGEKFRIISGERRYLASILSGKDTIPVHIVKKPSELDMRYLQWIENINRENLSLAEVYHNIKMLNDSYYEMHEENLKASSIQDLLGCSKTQSFAYHSLLNSSRDVLELIFQGKLNNLDLVYELNRVKSGKEQLLEKIKAGDNSKNVKVAIKSHKEKNTKSNSPQNISLIRTANHSVAKRIYEVLHTSFSSNENLPQIDWSSHKDIKKAFASMIKRVEEQL